MIISLQAPGVKDLYCELCQQVIQFHISVKGIVSRIITRVLLDTPYSFENQILDGIDF